MYYRQILDEAINESDTYKKSFPEILMYTNIYTQLIDIKENIIVKEQYLSENEVFKKYNLGAIAVKNFDLEYEEYGQKLSDIFAGSFRYPGMIEGNEDIPNKHSN